MAAISIDQADVANLPELTELFELYRAFYKKPSAPDQAEAFLRERLERNESIVYLAYANKDIPNRQHAVGFTQLYPIFSSTQMKRLWLLNDLYVREDYRGQGISRMLIDRAKQLARTTQASGLLLETAKDNHIGNILYPRAGFTLASEHYNFYLWSVE